MRMLLISPDRDKKRKKYLLSKNIVKVPPISLLAVASCTPSEWEVKIVDEKNEDINFDEKVDIVGISCYTPESLRAYEISEEFRKRGIKVVIGGIHASVLPEEVSNHCDSVLIGEAEGIWETLLDDFKKGRLKKFYFNKTFPDLSNSQLWNVNLLKGKKYIFYMVQTQRGCPNNCEFCSVPSVYGRTIRFRPLKTIEKEIEQIGSRYILFSDDNFLKNEERVREILSICKNSRKIFLIQTDVASISNFSLTRESIKAGCRVFFIGFESIEKNNLIQINKKINLKYDYKEIIKFIHDEGGYVVGSFIFGFDEDDESIFETPLPGTPLFEKFKKEGRILTYNWEKYDCVHCVFIPKKLKVEKLQEGLNWCYKNFYNFPSVFKKILSSLKTAKIFIPINLGYFLVGKRGIAKI